MTIAFDAVSNPGNFTADSNFTHTPAADPAGVLVLIAQALSDLDQMVAVTYGGANVPRFGSAVISSGEVMRVYGFFLGEDIPPGAQNVNIDINSTQNYRPIVITVTAGNDTEIKDWDIVQAITANPSITLQTGAAETFIAAILASGHDAVGSHSNGSGYTGIHQADPGSATSRSERRTNIATGGDIAVSFTQTSEEACMIAVAIGEVEPPDARPLPETIIAIVASPYDETIEVEIQGPPYPFGVTDLDGSMTYDLFGAEQKVYLASSDYTSEPADTPANTHFDGVLVQPFTYEVRLFQGQEPAGRSRPGFGEIRIGNGAARGGQGLLDDRLHLGWDGRELALFRGDKYAAFSTFVLEAKLTCDGLGWDEQAISVRLRDNQGIFDRPIGGSLYGGTGGDDGGSDLAGKWRPQLYGRGFNLPAPLIDAPNLVFQFHDRQAQAVDAVRDKGVALTQTGDYPTYGALVAASIAASHYATCLAQGMVRLSSAPQGQVTIDARGDAIGGIVTPGYVETTGGIVRRIVTTRVGADRFPDPSGLDTAAFAQIDSDQPAPVGFWTGIETLTCAEVLDRLMTGIGGWWHVTLPGLFTLGVLEDTTGTADFTVDAGEIVGRIRRDNFLPAWSQRVGWKRNWGVQSADALAGSVTPADRQLYSTEYRFAAASDGNVISKHRLARDVEVPGYFALEADALDEAGRRLPLYGAERDLYSVPIKGDPFAYTMGALVEVTGFERFDFSGGKKFRLIGLSADAVREKVTLVLWG